MEGLVEDFRIPNGKLIAFDCETTGFAYRKGDRFYCISFSNEHGETAVVSFPVDPFTRQVNYTANEEAFETLREFFSNPYITKIAHNAQFDVRFVQAAGMKVEGPIVCTMSLIRLLRSDAKLALKPFCKEYLGFPDDDEKELKDATRKARAEGKKKGYAIHQGKSESDEGSLAPDYWLAGKTYFEPYCVRDSLRAMAVYRELTPGIKETSSEKLWKTELETWKVLRHIENRGICTDINAIKENEEVIKKKLKTYQTAAHKAVQSYYPFKIKTFNLRSSKKLSYLFYNRIKEPVRFTTPKGSPSTDTIALQHMSHPLAKTILNIRACYKTLEFMDQYLQYAEKGDDGQYYIHPEFSSSIPSTGRESSSRPNMQQVASGEGDKELEVTVEARSVFIPRPKYFLRSFDWKNIEVYIPAFKSGEKRLIDILINKGDVHGTTAERLTKRLKMDVTRYTAKRIFFGLQYGIGIKKLSRLLNIESEAAGTIIAGFQEEYPLLFDWMDHLKWDARSKGYINTAYGRRQYVPSDAEYKAVNYYVQGTASSILKNAKIKVFNALKLHSWAVQAYIVLPIHDELLIEYRQNDSSKILDEIVTECMQDNPELEMEVNIPVTVSRIGKNWAEKFKEKTVYSAGEIIYEGEASTNGVLLSRNRENGNSSGKSIRKSLPISRLSERRKILYQFR